MALRKLCLSSSFLPPSSSSLIISSPLCSSSPLSKQQRHAKNKKHNQTCNNDLSQQEQVVNLYRSLLQVGRDWPTMPNREERSLGVQIISKTKLSFRKNQHVADPIKITELIEFGRKELQSLQRLEHNELNHQYGSFSIDIIPRNMQDTETLLATKKQAKEKRKNIPFMDRMMQAVLGAPPEPPFPQKKSQKQ